MPLDQGLRWQPPSRRAPSPRDRRRWAVLVALGTVGAATLVAAALVIAAISQVGAPRAPSAKSFNVGDLPTPAAAPAVDGLQQASSGAAAPPLQPLDRSLLAFVREGDVWIADLVSGEERRLTRDGANLAPRLSADGRWISFVKDVGEVWTMATDGSRARRMPGRNVSWSPATSQQAIVTLTGAIWVINGDGTGARELVKEDGGSRAIAWSPDGRRIAYQTFGPGLDGSSRLETYVADVVTGSVMGVAGLASRSGSLATTPRLLGWTSRGDGLVMFVPRLAESGTTWSLAVALLDGPHLATLVESVLNLNSGAAIDPRTGLVAIVVRPEDASRRFQLAVIDGSTVLARSPAEEMAPLWPVWSATGGLAYIRSLPDAGTTNPRGRAIGLWTREGGFVAAPEMDGTFDERPIWLNGEVLVFRRPQRGGGDCGRRAVGSGCVDVPGGGPIRQRAGGGGGLRPERLGRVRVSLRPALVPGQRDVAHGDGDDRGKGLPCDTPRLFRTRRAALVPWARARDGTLQRGATQAVIAGR